MHMHMHTRTLHINRHIHIHKERHTTEAPKKDKFQTDMHTNPSKDIYKNDSYSHSDTLKTYELHKDTHT